MSTRTGPPGDHISRRQFLSATAAAAGYLAVSGAHRFLYPAHAGAQGPQPLPRAHASLTTRPTSAGPRVVHVHSPHATYWNYATGWYGDCVSQAEVDKMVDDGVMALTGEATAAAAWQCLLPGYAPGERVAIKINLNNAWGLDDGDNIIDALIEPVNAVVGGLKQIGVAEADIWVYDAIRTIPDRFRNGCDYPGVQFSGSDVNPQGFSDTQRVAFFPPAGSSPLADQRLSQVLVDAHYLINMPIMKKHSHAYVTLSFKNHFGTIEDCAAVHGPTFPADSTYRPDYNPLVDIYQNLHIVGKTVLTIGDGLFASRGNQSTTPAPWGTFGDRAPNSLFFSQDPVAIDCVMYDFLEAEAGVPSTADDYLMLAAQVGLGIFEHRAPGVADPAGWYSLIDYVPLDLSRETAHKVYVPFLQR